MDTQIQKISSWLGTGSINVFGRPFAGKDTQGRILAEILGGALIAGGEILRHYKNQENLQEIMASGNLIPSDLYLRIVLPYLSKSELKDKPLILSEVGRMKGEEPIVLEATAHSGHPTKAVVLLRFSEEDVWQRFNQAVTDKDRGQRQDDRREVLQTRLDRFREKVEPVIEFYREKDLLVEVDGTKSRQEVTKDILIALENKGGSTHLS